MTPNCLDLTLEINPISLSTLSVTLLSKVYTRKFWAMYNSSVRDDIFETKSKVTEIYV